MVSPSLPPTITPKKGPWQGDVEGDDLGSPAVPLGLLKGTYRFSFLYPFLPCSYASGYIISPPRTRT